MYVKFPMYDDLGKLSHLDKSKLNFVIWTTTIWTLPGNLAIALHPQEEYAVVRADGGEMYIMARPLVEKVMKIGGVEHYEIVETHETFQQDNTYTRFNQWGNYRSLGLSLRYSFQAGKKIRVKTVYGT